MHLLARVFIAATPILLSLPAQAEEQTMLHVITRNISDSIKPGTFAAQPRDIWLSGTKYMRVDEAPDPDQHIQGTIIAVEPDVWMWNRDGNEANHIVDKGPDYNVHADLGDNPDSKDTQGLEVGREKEFFASHDAKAGPDETIEGVAVSVLKVHIGETDLTLYTKKSDGLPYQVSVVAPKDSYQVRYEAYEPGLAFRPELFVLPKDVKVTDAKQ